jgi:hypothetical protein
MTREIRGIIALATWRPSPFSGGCAFSWLIRGMDHYARSSLRSYSQIYLLPGSTSLVHSHPAQALPSPCPPGFTCAECSVL